MRVALFLLVVFVVCVPSGVAQSEPPDEPEANPGRPTVSTPATLTPVGYLQFETGFLGARDSPEFSSRYGFNEVSSQASQPGDKRGRIFSVSPADDLAPLDRRFS